MLTEHDDGCGPMAAAFLRDYSPKIDAVSAGRVPGTKYPTLLVTAMRECLIDLEGYVPQGCATLELASFDAVYECPDLPCPDTLEACRDLRDVVKNASYRFFRCLLPSMS